MLSVEHHGTLTYEAQPRSGSVDMLEGYPCDTMVLYRYVVVLTQLPAVVLGVFAVGGGGNVAD